MKPYVLILAVGLMSLASCGKKNCRTDVSDGIVEKCDSAAASEVAESSASQSMHLDSASFHFKTKFASVDLQILVPTDTSKASQEMARGIWKAFDESVTSSYGDGSRLFAPYSDDRSDLRRAVGYYGQLLYKLLEAESREMFAEMTSGDASLSRDDVEPYLFERQVEVSKTGNLPHHVVFNLSWYGYAGGAHGGMLQQFLTFDKRTGKRVREVLPASAQKVLQKEMRRGLCKYLDCDDAQLHDLLMLDDDIFGLIPFPQEPPYLTDSGVAFVYQQYEIAPYAAGMPTFVIPYDKLRSLLLVEP